MTVSQARAMTGRVVIFQACVYRASESLLLQSHEEYAAILPSSTTAGRPFLPNIDTVTDCLDWRIGLVGAPSGSDVGRETARSSRVRSPSSAVMACPNTNIQDFPDRSLRGSDPSRRNCNGSSPGQTAHSTWALLGTSWMSGDVFNNAARLATAEFTHAHTLMCTIARINAA